MMEALADAEPLPPDELPARDDRKPGSARTARSSPTCSSCCSRSGRKEINVAPRLLARTEELEALAAGAREGLAILEGWRFDQFGRDALALVEGRLAFAVRNGKLLMTRTEEEEMMRVTIWAAGLLAGCTTMGATKHRCPPKRHADGRPGAAGRPASDGASSAPKRCG